MRLRVCFCGARAACLCRRSPGVKADELNREKQEFRKNLLVRGAASAERLRAGALRQ